MSNDVRKKEHFVLSILEEILICVFFARKEMTLRSPNVGLTYTNYILKQSLSKYLGTFGKNVVKNGYNQHSPQI